MRGVFFGEMRYILLTILLIIIPLIGCDGSDGTEEAKKTIPTVTTEPSPTPTVKPSPNPTYEPLDLKTPPVETIEPTLTASPSFEESQPEPAQTNVGLSPDSPWPIEGHDIKRTGRSNYAGPENPHLKWSFEVGGHVWSGPVIAGDGTIYFGSLDGCLYAVNRDGTLKWKYTTEGSVESPIIAADGTLHFISRGNNLYALDSNGELKWKFETEGRPSSTALAPDGTIYVGAANLKTYVNKLYAINPDGSLKWQYEVGRWICPSSSIADDGTIYFCDGSYLYALNQNGTLKWRYSFRSSSWSSPVIDEFGTIYVNTWEGTILAITPYGILKREYKTGSESSILAISIAADGSLYFFDSDYIYAIRPDGTPYLKLRYPRRVGSSKLTIDKDGNFYFGSVSGYIHVYGPDGSYKWGVHLGREICSPVAIGSDGTVYVGSADEPHGDFFKGEAWLYAIGD